MATNMQMNFEPIPMATRIPSFQPSQALRAILEILNENNSPSTRDKANPAWSVCYGDGNKYADEF
jgi:hypothetical protein